MTNDALRTARRREQRLAAGLCQECGKRPPLLRRKTCKPCVLRVKERRGKERGKVVGAPGYRMTRAQRKAAGLPQRARYGFCWWCSRKLWGASFVEKVIDGEKRTLHRACAERPETVKLTPPRQIPSRPGRGERFTTEKPKRPVEILAGTDDATRSRPAPTAATFERRVCASLVLL